jgi:lipooligosaccharide transport system ATP-binding protein
MKILSVNNLCKNYKNFKAIDNLSFSVDNGMCFGLLGPNGAGKSTAISCITGLYPPTSGSVLIEGFDVHLQPKLAKRSIGVCFQDDSVETEFSVFEQLVLHASYFRIPKKEAVKKATYLLEKLQLEDKILYLTPSLSGGMKRRLQIARALISSPKFLILDEPTTGLDPEARRILWDIILEVKMKGTAILLTTHYMDEAERLCDKIALIYQGKIYDFGSPNHLIEKHIGLDLVTEEIKPGIFYKRPPNLEDVFLKLAGSKLNERYFHSYE